MRENKIEGEQMKERGREIVYEVSPFIFVPVYIFTKIEMSIEKSVFCLLIS